MHRVDQASYRVRSTWLYTLAVGCLIGGAASAEEPRTATSAHGCTASSAPRDPEAARVAFRAGQTAFSEGGYARAVELWDQAYGDDCTAHALLLNLAMAQELLGRPDEAIQTLTLFNERAPRSPYVDANLKRIQRLQLAAADKTRERARRERALWGPAERPTPDDGMSLSLPIAVGAVGTAVALVGTVLFVEGRSSAASAEERCETSRQACTEEGLVDGERARARAQVGGWMAGGGLLTAAGGLVWHLLASPRRPLDQPAATAVSLSADVPAQAARVEWAGHF
jgi:tetratricopeptide (TPR) repeat protein